jgi:hypothetical protein
MLPNAMQGYATIKLPGSASIRANASYLWLTVNALAALLLGAVALLGVALSVRDGWRLVGPGNVRWHRLGLRSRRLVQPG